MNNLLRLANRYRNNATQLCTMATTERAPETAELLQILADIYGKKAAVAEAIEQTHYSLLSGDFDTQ